jgi:cyclase
MRGDLTMQENPFFRVEVVAEGVYAALAKAGQGAIANAAIVDLGDQTLLFDTFASPAAATALRHAAEHLTGRPVTYMLNSHRHADHVLGNQVFGNVPIIATAATRTLMADLTLPLLKALREDADAMAADMERDIIVLPTGARREDLTSYLNDVRHLFTQAEGLTLTLPTLTFEDEIVFRGSRRTAHFLHKGANHTPSDSILYLPDAKILLTADVVVVQNHPVVVQGDRLHWIETLDSLLALDIEQVIPGHGAVGSRDDVILMQAYLRDLSVTAKDLVEAGASVETIEQHPVPAPHEALRWSFNYTRNLTAAVAEYTKGKTDVV